MSPVKPVVSAAHNSIPENMEYHQFSLNSLISVRKLNGKACSQEKVRVYFPHQIEKRQLRHHLGQ